MVDHHGATLLNGKNLSLERLYLCKDTNTDHYQIRSQTRTYQNTGESSVDFEERDKLSQDEIGIFGDNMTGFGEHFFYFNEDKEKYISYWKNGTVKSIINLYVNYNVLLKNYRQSPDFSIMLLTNCVLKTFPIKKTIQFDETGHRFKTTDNEKYFKFTLKKVKKYLKNRGLIAPNSQYNLIIDRAVENQKGLWKLYIPDPKNNKGSLVVILDGDTGKLISEKPPQRFGL